MLNKKLTLLATCAVGAVTLSACAKPEPKCISVDGPLVVEDLTYDKLAGDALPRCEEEKPDEEVLEYRPDGDGADPDGPGPSGSDSPGQPNSPGERGG